MQLYKHRQAGTLMRVAFGLAVVVAPVLFLLASETRLGTGLAEP